MCANNNSCHGVHNNMLAASETYTPGFISRKALRLKTFVRNTLWHLHTEGFLNTLSLAISKITPITNPLKCNQMPQSDSCVFTANETLNLQPGELVEVKSEQEILSTLDGNKKYKGLLWMPSMRKFCGKRYYVFKRLETILLEATGEVRKIKNTVLLKDALCDGCDFYGCDRSCFHYWREVWLKRVELDKTGEAINNKQ